MSVSYNTGQAIYADVIARAPVKDTVAGDKVERLVLQAYFDLLKMHQWSWLKKYPPAVIDVPDVIFDTVIITKGSKEATITTDSAVTDLANYKLQHQSNTKVYRIESHADLVATLDATWKEDAITSAENCYVYKDEFDLNANCWMPYSFFDRTNARPVDFIGDAEMKAEQFSEWYGTQIERVSLIADKKIRVKPWILEGITLEYEYCEKQSTLTFDGVTATDTPNIPLYDRHIIADMVLLMVWQEWDDTPNLATKIERIERKVADNIKRMIANDRGRTLENMDFYA